MIQVLFALLLCSNKNIMRYKNRAFFELASNEFGRPKIQLSVPASTEIGRPKFLLASNSIQWDEIPIPL